MLRRSIFAVALCTLAACQDYNFNPVGKCVIQPGSSRVTLTNLSTADILFVVDDSGSMQAEQQRLATNFRAFIDALAAAQAARINQDKLAPFEFHVAVTTSSVFEAWSASSPTTCSGSPLACNVSPTHYGTAPAPIACGAQGASCDELIRSYFFQTTDPTKALTFCSKPGVATPNTPFPAGDFVAAPGNPKVLHFTKDLDWANWPAIPDPKITSLIAQFQANIDVGICGSGMEQHFEASRLAVKKALQQDGLTQVSGVAPTDWPHPGAKMVVVWLGDEDDCSNPNDPTKSLFFTNATSNPGFDVCTSDANLPVDQQVEFKLADYAGFFLGLGRPFGAAFIYSAQLGSCVKDPNTGNVVCNAGTCACQCPTSCASCGPTQTGECFLPSPTDPEQCSGKATTDNLHSRYHQLSSLLRAGGADTFEASVCDANWSATLQGIANLVTPARSLTLPTQPATSQVAVLRIESADGSSSRYCKGPGPGLDWNFVDCKTGAAAPAGTTTSCIIINHTQPRDTGCGEANPGETYIMQYLGIVPEGGCLVQPGDGANESSDCSAKLGGAKTDWQCFGGTATTAGTCVCQAG